MLHIRRERKKRFLQVLSSYAAYSIVNEKSRSVYMDPCHLGRSNSIMNTYKIYREAAEAGNESNFKRFIHMPIEKFKELLIKTKDSMQHKSTHLHPISAEERLVITLRFLAHGISYAALSAEFMVADTTVSKIVAETTKIIVEKMKDECLPFPTEARWKKAAEDFEKNWNFPLCCGSIDGKHVEVVAPPNSGSEYFNYKKTFSIVLMAVADANYEFLYVSIGGNGRMSDSGLFNQSDLCTLIENEKINFPADCLLNGVRLPHVIVCDEGFALTERMIRPFSKSDLSTDERKIFNYRLSRARRVVENVFGIASARWRVLRSPIQAKEETIVNIIMTCCILHNFLRQSDSAIQPTARYIPPRFADFEDGEHKWRAGTWRSARKGLKRIQKTKSRNSSKAAKDIRNKFAQFFTSKEGSVPWQLKHIRRGAPDL